VREAWPDGGLVTVVTADHGEHFGEHSLLGHEFSVRNAVLQVPLVVHGLAGVAPAQIDTPLTLADVAGSVLAWAGVRQPGDPPALPEGRDAPGSPRSFFALYSDTVLEMPEGLVHIVQLDPEEADRRRNGCGIDDRVFGDTHALTRYPFKLIAFAHHPPQLYDLSWDPGERSDLAAQRAELVAEMSEELAALVAALPQRDTDEEPELEPGAREALRGLGYLE
jgi:arylsulfatase A-like enzyme